MTWPTLCDEPQPDPKRLSEAELRALDVPDVLDTALEKAMDAIEREDERRE